VTPTSLRQEFVVGGDVQSVHIVQLGFIPITSG
jgi:hypothetical protein